LEEKIRSKRVCKDAARFSVASRRPVRSLPIIHESLQQFWKQLEEEGEYPLFSLLHCG
jgi:hypothetical protein